MRALTIARVNVVRMMRDRVALFFVFVVPVILILLIGIAFGGGSIPLVGVVQGDRGPLARELVTRLGHGGNPRVRSFDTASGLADAVERGTVQAGVVIPRGYEAALRGGRTAEVRYLATPSNLSVAVRTTVDSVVAEQAALVGAARFAAAEQGIGFDEALARARRVAATAPEVRVESRAAGREPQEGGGQFGLGAASQLVLFVFVSSLAGAAAVVQTRRLGVSRRMLSAPVRAWTIVAGEGLGRFAVAMLQGVFIVVFSAVLFGVQWGNLAAASALTVAYALVCTGVAMLAGAALSNESQVGALVPLGLGLAALGGCMVPLEIFSPTMQRVAHVTPQAWAIEGFTKLVRTGAGLAQVAPQIGVLTGFALVLLALAAWRLRRAIVGP